MTPLGLLTSAKTLFPIRSSAPLLQIRTWNSFCPWAQTLNSVCTNLSPSFECLANLALGMVVLSCMQRQNIHFLSLLPLSALPPGVDDTHPRSPRFKVSSTLWPQFLISLFFLQTLLEASCLFPFHLFFRSLPCGLEVSRDGRIPEVLGTAVFSCDKTLSSLGFPGKAQVKTSPLPGTTMLWCVLHYLTLRSLLSFPGHLFWTLAASQFSLFLCISSPRFELLPVSQH